MKFINVESSNIAAIAWEDDETLFVRYHNGNIYYFEDVPETVYQEFLAAESKGRYMNSHIKNVYSYRRFTEDNK